MAQIQCNYFKPKGPKKFGHWPKFGPAAHGLETLLLYTIQYTVLYTVQCTVRVHSNRTFSFRFVALRTTLVTCLQALDLAAAYPDIPFRNTPTFYQLVLSLLGTLTRLTHELKYGVLVEYSIA